MTSVGSSDTAEPKVLVRVEGSVGRLTLNRPRAINALDHEMVGILTDALARWADDPSVTAVVLDGAGERGLCAGGDIVSIHDDAKNGGTGSLDFWRDEYILNAAIARFPKPYVAIMDGIVMGGGVGVSAHGNTRIVTDRSMIAMPETGIGFIPDVGGTYLLSRAPGETGTHLALTTGRMNGADAIALGFADHYVPADVIGEFVDAIVADGVEKALVTYGRTPPASDLAARRDWIDAAYSADTVGEILDRLRRRPEDAAHEAATAIEGKSPIALTVTLRSLRRAREADSLEAVLDEEFRVSSASLRSHDLVEGIRAQVIDKDRTPHWSPATLADVDEAAVDAYFAPVENELGLTAPAGGAS